MAKPTQKEAKKGSKSKGAKEMPAAVKPAPGSSEWVGVGQSGIHQSGLFALKAIPAKTRMIEYVGHKVTKGESDRRAHLQEEKGRGVGDGTVYIFTLNDRYDIDGAVDWNLARFANHSCAPNAETDVVNGHIYLIARRVIKKGEEIVYDYGFDLEHWEGHPCRCGSKKCVGYIVGDEYHDKLRRKVAAREKEKAREEKKAAKAEKTKAKEGTSEA